MFAGLDIVWIMEIETIYANYERFSENGRMVGWLLSLIGYLSSSNDHLPLIFFYYGCDVPRCF